ncbi:MAG: hypothetical protein ACKVVT_10455 [Dehalococcoidia bacterium]
MHPYPGLPIREGGPPLQRPPRDATFLADGDALIARSVATQRPLLGTNAEALAWTAGRHFLIAGGTGPGLGGAYVTALLASGLPASVTVVSRDLRQSIGHATGQLFGTLAEASHRKLAFTWTNDGLALEGPDFDSLVATLRAAGARDIVYINTVAAANSGILPGLPDVYAKDIDDDELFQWKLPLLSEKQIEATAFVMGELAVAFPRALAVAGIGVACEVYADWRGSLDRESRDPVSPAFARQGAYSTSLYLPKDIIHEEVQRRYGAPGPRAIDIFFPVMNTRALPLIPGGRLMNELISAVLQRSGVRQKEVAELAVDALVVIGQALSDRWSNPFPRLDDYELPLDLWVQELQQRVAGDPADPFYYRRWIGGG